MAKEIHVVLLKTFDALLESRCFEVCRELVGALALFGDLLSCLETVFGNPNGVACKRIKGSEEFFKFIEELWKSESPSELPSSSSHEGRKLQKSRVLERYRKV